MKSDQELLEEYIENEDQTAFAALVERHYGMVYRVGRRSSLEHDAAEDVAMRVFALLADQAADLTKPETLSAWLHGVARRQALNEIRRYNRMAEREKQYGEIMRDEKSTEALSENELRELRVVFDVSLLELPEGQRQAVVLRYLEGHDQKSAATIAGCPQGTLGYWASEGLKKLRDIVKKRGVTLAAPALIAFLDFEAQAASNVLVPKTMISQLIQSRSLSPKTSTNGLKGAWKKMLTTKTLIIGTLAILLTAFSGKLFLNRENSKNIKEVFQKNSRTTKSLKNTQNKRETHSQTLKAAKPSSSGHLSLDSRRNEGKAVEKGEPLFTIFLQSAKAIDVDELDLYIYLDTSGYTVKCLRKKILSDPLRVVVFRRDLVDRKPVFSSIFGNHKKSNKDRFKDSLQLPAVSIDVKGFLATQFEPVEKVKGAFQDMYVDLFDGPEFVGLVMNELGKPFPGVMVEVEQARESLYSVRRPESDKSSIASQGDKSPFSCVTGNDGRFYCTDFDYGKLKITLRIPGHTDLMSRNYTIDFQQDSESPKLFTYNCGDGSLRGRLIDECYSPVENGVILLTQKLRRVACVKTNAEGCFLVSGLKAGDYELHVNVNIKFKRANSNYCRNSPERVQIMPGKELDFGDVFLETGFELRGTVTRESKNKTTGLILTSSYTNLHEKELHALKSRFNHLKNLVSAPKFIEYVDDLTHSGAYLYHTSLHTYHYPSMLWDIEVTTTDHKGKFKFEHLRDAPCFVSTSDESFYCPQLLMPKSGEQLVDLKRFPMFTCRGKFLSESGKELKPYACARIALNYYENGKLKTKWRPARSSSGRRFSIEHLIRALLTDEYEKTGKIPIKLIFRVFGFKEHIEYFNLEKLDDNLVYDLGEIVLRKKIGEDSK